MKKVGGSSVVEQKGFRSNLRHSDQEDGCMDKKCPVCGKVYMTFDKKKKYCSDACAKKANKEK